MKRAARWHLLDAILVLVAPDGEVIFSPPLPSNGPVQAVASGCSASVG